MVYIVYSVYGMTTYSADRDRTGRNPRPYWKKKRAVLPSNQIMSGTTGFAYIITVGFDVKGANKRSLLVYTITFPLPQWSHQSEYYKQYLGDVPKHLRI